MPESLQSAQGLEHVQRIEALSEELKPIATGLPSVVNKLSGIRAVLFDVYGTLLISGSGDVGSASDDENIDAMEQALKEAPIRGTHGEATAMRAVELLAKMIHRMHAKSRKEGIDFPEVEIREVWREVLTVLGEEGLASESFQEKTLLNLAIEYECRSNPVWPMPGMVETLAKLKQTELRLGIVSNAQFYTPLVLQAFLRCPVAEAGFDDALCVWSYEMGEAKPSITLFDEALKTLQVEHGISPNNVLYIGNDMLNDIWPASQAGCYTALFAGDDRSLRLRADDERCADLKPDVIITELNQIPDVLS